MIAVQLTREQWAIALSAAEGLRVQLLGLVGPFADGGSPRAMAAVRIIGELQWIERAMRRAVEEL